MADKTNLILLHELDQSQGNEEIQVTWKEMPDGTYALVGYAGDAGIVQTTSHGVSGVPVTSADMSSGANVSDVPESGKKIVITDIFVSNRDSSAMTFTFTEETSGTVICGPFDIPANSTQQFTPRSKAWKLATADKKLVCTTSGAGNVMVDSHYYSES